MTCYSDLLVTWVVEKKVILRPYRGTGLLDPQEKAPVLLQFIALKKTHTKTKRLSVWNANFATRIPLIMFPEQHK